MRTFVASAVVSLLACAVGCDSTPPLDPTATSMSQTNQHTTTQSSGAAGASGPTGAAGATVAAAATAAGAPIFSGDPRQRTIQNEGVATETDGAVGSTTTTGGGTTGAGGTAGTTAVAQPSGTSACDRPTGDLLVPPSLAALQQILRGT